MRFIDWLAIAFWPVAAFVFAIFIRLKKTLWHKTIYGAFAFGSFLLLTIILSAVIGHETEISVLDWHTFFICSGLFLFALVYFGWPGRKGPLRLKAAGCFLVLIGLLATAYGIKSLIGDLVLPRNQVEGVIERAYRTRGRSGVDYHLYINGRHYPTTADVFTQVHEGERVAAEVGAGSRTVFAVRPN